MSFLSIKLKVNQSSQIATIWSYLLVRRETIMNILLNSCQSLSGLKRKHFFHWMKPSGSFSCSSFCYCINIHRSLFGSSYTRSHFLFSSSSFAALKNILQKSLPALEQKLIGYSVQRPTENAFSWSLARWISNMKFQQTGCIGSKVGKNVLAKPFYLLDRKSCLLFQLWLYLIVTYSVFCR